MDIDLKQLQKLAKLCRSLGITHIKEGEFELSLSTQEPAKKSRSRRSNNQADETSTAVDDQFESDSLNDDDLLLWSVKSPVDSVLGDA